MKHSQIWRRMLGTAVAAACLASLSVPAGALEIIMPEEPMAVESADGARYLTTTAQRVSAEIPLILGVNVIGGNIYEGAVLIGGTDVNENPDPYVWNYNYLYPGTSMEGGTVSSGERREGTGDFDSSQYYNAGLSSAGLASANGLYFSGSANQVMSQALEEYGGVSYGVYNMIDVWFGFNSDVLEQIEFVQNEMDQSSEYYQEGYADYDPLLTDVATGSITSRAYAWAEMGGALSNYLAEHPEYSVRYGDPLAIGYNIQEFAFGIPYYIDALIDAGKITKLTGAYINSTTEDGLTFTLADPSTLGDVLPDSYAVGNTVNWLTGTYTMEQLKDAGVGVIVIGASGCSYVGTSTGGDNTNNETGSDSGNDAGLPSGGAHDVAGEGKDDGSGSSADSSGTLPGGGAHDVAGEGKDDGSGSSADSSGALPGGGAHDVDGEGKDDGSGSSADNSGTLPGGGAHDVAGEGKDDGSGSSADSGSDRPGGGAHDADGGEETKTQAFSVSRAFLEELMADVGYTAETAPVIIDGFHEQVTPGGGGYNYTPVTPLFVPYITAYIYLEQLAELAASGDEIAAAINPTAMVQFMFNEFFHVKDDAAYAIATYYIDTNWDATDSDLDKVPVTAAGAFVYDKDAIITAIQTGIQFALNHQDDESIWLTGAYREGEAAYTLAQMVVKSGVSSFADILSAANGDYSSITYDYENKQVWTTLDVTALVDYYGIDGLAALVDFYVTHMDNHPWNPDTTIEGTYGYGLKAAETVHFTDLSADSPYYAAAVWAYENDLLTGTSTTELVFAPDEGTTRAQLVTFLYHLAGEPKVSAGAVNPFIDVSTRDEYYTAVIWAYTNGLMIGTGAETFSPNQECSRAEVLTVLYRYAGKPTAPTASGFTDVTDEWYKDAVNWAVSTGVAAGTSATTFSPKQVSPRSELITFLYNVMA